MTYSFNPIQIVTGEFEEVIFDIETNGLLPEHVEPPFCMDRIHCLVIKDIHTEKTIEFVNNDEGNNLEEGVKILMDAKTIIGHNIIDFDIPAIALIYPYFVPEARIVDTLVMVRMCFADQKEKDFRLASTGKLAGRLIGTQGLEGWGQRLGMHKGDYKKDRENELKDIHKEKGLDAPTTEELHHYVWGTWSQNMHDYCINDVDVNMLVWTSILRCNWSREATIMEHQIHDLMVKQERNGFVFDKNKADKLAQDFQTQYDALAEEATADIGKWHRPLKAHTDEFVTEHGEHHARRTWGNVDTYKRNIDRSKSRAKAAAGGDFRKMMPDVYADVPLVKIELKEFNPNSRPQITDRLKTLYGWEPQDFTEKGAAKVNDEILRDLADDVPLAATLAELFFYKKRLGQVSDGKNGWLKLLRSDGRIHGRVNVGGTVSGRATHSSPNISQVPGVNAVEFGANEDKGITPEMAKEKGEEFLSKNAGNVNSWSAPIIVSSKWKENKSEWSIVARGRAGDYGYDCRELFTVPKGYKLVGCDLSGIEFRCLGNLTFPFDGGEIVDVVLNGDIHARNAQLAGITRSVAKRLLYAAMYGGGDGKLGSIVEPFSSAARQQSLGKTLRSKLMAAMPSLQKAIREIHKEMRKNSNTIRGLDGRRLYARSKHSALNLRLQSDGALIAKKWCLLVDDMFYEEGWDHGPNLEYFFCSWSHDEIQIAVREDLAERAAEIMEAAAPLAGEHFNFNCPVTAESAIGMTWAATH